ncbi:hypothetical protein [Actinacidiphila bryophytorum]|uniref:Uncharacterized lipoprotein SAV_5923 n=1 Tax=Actinacidiphila bryophytorum TaxID=1436133 RepID=A0A9W4E6U0_9ACTN|nr:hypothetical protein [Actinacidiphila bryophytorum]MBM9434822.1 hypothetical protein [Actinacidiphila bryophytorum]MBN6546821.1 hypothetical protein [Actinacidiphila bryophytorum]CAG7630546.1 Uncharacterized lipoprotein SAV_5923 [Actinacidiphila bryophytorum]
MNRRRVCLGAAAVALALPLAGCMTVHGERENIPSASTSEAARALADFTVINNRVGRAYDAKGIAEVESGALGATDAAGLTAKHANHPQGNPDYKPLAFSDSHYLIPRQVGWPKYFVVDTATNRSSTARWLLVFRRAAAGDPWKASYVAAVATADMPKFARDKDGYAVPLGLAGTDLLVQPGQLSADYSTYLGGSGGSDVFADGPSTSQVRSDRNAHAKTANSVTQYADQPAAGGDFTPVALRTADGGALVFFASRHQSRATFRAGYRLSIDDDTKALMTGTPRTSVTLSRLADSAVTVPKAGGGKKVVFLSRVVGLVTAKGE